MYYSPKLIRVTTIVAIALALSSCATMEQPPAKTSSLVSTLGAQSDSNVEAAAEAGTAEQDAAASDNQYTLYSGTDQVIRMPKKQKRVKLLGEDVSLNFEQRRSVVRRFVSVAKLGILDVAGVHVGVAIVSA